MTPVYPIRLTALAPVPDTAVARPRLWLRELFSTPNQIPGSLMAPSWQALSEEGDPRIFWEGVLQLAHDCELRGEEGAALHLYTRSLELLSDEGQRRRFQERRDALAGVGALNARRWDALGRRFARQATDPAMVGSFLVAGGAAAVVRNTTWALLESQATSWLGRGFGTRVLAGTAAYLAEVPTFVAAHRGLQHFFHGPQNPGESRPLADDLAAAALFLGTVQLTGALSGPALHSLRASPALAGMGRIGASLGGIYLGQRLEEVSQFRPGRDEASRWIDALNTFFQMSVGGRLAREILPAPVRLASADVASPRPTEISLARAAAASVPTQAPRLRGTLSSAQQQNLRARLGPRVSSYLEQLVHSLGEQTGDPDGLIERLGETRIVQLRNLEVGLLRLNHALAHSRPQHSRGSYLNWLTRIAFVEILRRPPARASQGGDPAPENSPFNLDELLGYLFHGGNIRDFEERMASLFPQYRLRPLAELSAELFAEGPRARRAQRLPISPRARQVLQAFIATRRRLDPSDPFVGDFEVLLRAFETMPTENNSRIPEYVQAALEEAHGSPLAYLRVYRLAEILTREAVFYPKILELADPDLSFHPFSRRLDYPATGEALLTTQHNAYFGDEDMARFFSEFYESLPELSDLALAARRTERRREVLRNVWRLPRRLTREDIIQALDKLGDELSHYLADALDTNQFRLLILEDGEFNSLAQQYYGREIMTALYIDQLEWEGQVRETVVLRQVRPEVFSHGPFIEAVFIRLGRLIHEYEHYRHTDPNHPLTRNEIFRQEIKAVQREFSWFARQGDLSWVSDLSMEASGGWAMHLRDKIEEWYFWHREESE